MKNNYIYIFLTGILILSLSACDFEKINTNEFEMTEEQGKLDGFILGGSFLAMQKAVTIVGTQADGTNIVNQYQISYNLSADVWGGYFGQNNNWNSGNNNTTNFLIDAWISASYRNTYMAAFAPWKKIQEKSDNIAEYIALSQVLKISAWNKATDMFGPIPYKKAGEVLMVVPYDSQQDVYTSFFEDLEGAINVLTEKANQGTKIIPRFDAVYAGNTTQWVKYANSLMLRLAMRIRYADPELAKKYAEIAVNHPIGVMVSATDEAKMGNGAGYSFVNNIETLANQYAECRMSSSMFSYLLGYRDPRLSAYFKSSEDDKNNGDRNYGVLAFDNNPYQGIPTGHVDGNNDIYKTFSRPNIETATPTYWMRASEVYFLRAEGALIGWNMGGDALSLYENGISMSFEENGVESNKVDAYINSGNEPMNYSISVGRYNYSAAAPTSATVAFEGNEEAKLEKIMIQKWIAMYPNGQEAWSEWRRTGYPKLHQVINDRGGLGVNGVRRMNYPTSAYQSEEDKLNIQEAIKMLGGEDKPSTKLWWDAKKLF